MTPADAIATCLASLAVCVGLFLLRKSRPSVRLGFEVAALGILTAVLHWHSSSPVLNFNRSSVGDHGPWTQLAASVWWFVAAKVVASLVGAILGHDERSREARLLSDLLGAGVYVLAALCVLNFVLDLPVKGLERSEISLNRQIPFTGKL